MPLLNVSRVVSNPMFAQAFIIERSSGGDFAVSGDWVDTTLQVSMWGIIQPATAKELLQLPDGDRVKEVKSFHSEQEMFITHANNADLTTTGYNAGISDIAIWNGQHYRLAKRYEWDDFGYYKALGVRIEGE